MVGLRRGSSVFCLKMDWKQQSGGVGVRNLETIANHYRKCWTGWIICNWSGNKRKGPTNELLINISKRIFENLCPSFIHNIYQSFARKFICVMLFSPPCLPPTRAKILWKVFEYLSSRRCKWFFIVLFAPNSSSFVYSDKWQSKQKNLEILLAAPQPYTITLYREAWFDVVMCVISAWRIEPPFPQRQTCHSQTTLKYEIEGMRWES